MRKSFGRMITLLARKSQAHIGNIVSKHGLTAAEEPFFMALLYHEGLTQDELTAIVCVDKAVTTRVVRSLESKGFLTRVQDERDRRQNRIYPTVKVTELGETISKDLLQFSSQLTEGIDPETLAVVYDALSKMENNLVMIKQGEDAKGE